MPVESQSAGQMSKSLAMEPALQAKKRVEPAFLKTSPVKSVSEPMMQSKKRIEPFVLTQKASSENVVSVEMQSKKKAQAPVSALQSEPPIQSKRRTPGPPTTLTNGFYDNGFTQEDYALLGNQDKFAENVKYKVRPAQVTRDPSPPKQMKLQKKEKENKLPNPGPVVDTSQFSKPVTPLAPRRQKNQPQLQVKEQKESNVQQGLSEHVQKKVLRSPKQSVSEPKPSVNVEKLNLDNLESPVVKDQPKIEKTVITKEANIQKDSKAELAGKDLPKEALAKNAVKKEQAAMNKEGSTESTKCVESKNLNLGDPVKDSMKTKKIGNMNEFVQTNLEKGIADSAAEAPAEYALKYKTGIAPPRPTKKVSEYQKQFAWKTGLPASPLLKAEQNLGSEQVVYNSVPTLSPPKKDVIPKVTEYQKQFKEFPLVPVPKEDRTEPVQSKKVQLQRSKSMEGLSPAEIPTAGSKPVIAPNNRRLTMETDQKPVEPAPVVPRKKQRQFQSEYKSNFKSPTRFNYLQGSWQGADPPQVKIKGPEDTTAQPELANWFAEVIELRRKASEYRKRAEGTHFSREHLVQLMAKQTDLWDASTLSARSNLSALSLESGLAAHKNKQQRKEKLLKEGYSTAATIASEDEQKVDSVMMDEEYESPPQKKQAWIDQEDISEREYEEDISPEGRLTTPKLRDQIKNDGNQRRRHHLDRTTPCVGGAILSSPPQQKKYRTGKRMMGSSDNGSVVVSDVLDEEEDVYQEAVYKPLAGQKTFTMDRGYIAPTPTFGLATRDTHALRDYDAPGDKPLPTEFVHSPVRGKLERPGGLNTIDEGFSETYNRTKAGGLPVPRIDQDDDVLSVSMQSIASSCSVASATLERARKRKEEFWGKNGIASR